VEYILSQHGYESTSIGNPLKALSLVFQLKPDLILCDIAMPELDGYEICAMLRKSTAFRQTPIVMLTGKDGFIDRVKARMVGATDYLTKPFGENELLMLVEKYAGSGDPNHPKPDRLLADALEDELELDLADPASASSAPFS
jgi:twitching motility two-component system response regulator PilG